MGGFLVLVSVLVTVVIMPTIEPGIKIKDTQDNSITLTAFEKKFDRVDLYARGFCNQKGKEHKLNAEKSRKYYFPSSLNVYKYDCVLQSTEEAAMTSPSSEEVSAVATVEEVLEPEKDTNSECPSNIYEGQQQDDGSWETVCKD